MTNQGVFRVEMLYASERPLSITIMPSGRFFGGKPCYSYTLAGFIDTDEHGGTRKPVTITGADLAGWADAERMAMSLASSFEDEVTRLSGNPDAWTAMLLVNHSEPITGLADKYGDPLPDYTRDQWALLESEGERLGNWAITEED